MPQPLSLDPQAALPTGNAIPLSPRSPRTPPGLYTSLGSSPHQFRLLKIVHSGPDQVPRFELEVASLNKSRPIFNALSYVWGEHRAETTITVDNRPVSVTANLANALAQIADGLHAPRRRPGSQALTRCEYLWVDALCINQEDTREREQQVKLMRNIYTRARRVLAWLGPANHDAVYLINLIAQKITSNPVATDAKWLTDPDLPFAGSTDDGRRADKFFEAVSLIDKNPYWTRAWIVQEMVLAQSVWFVAGRSVVDDVGVNQVDRWLRQLKGGWIVHPPEVNQSVWDRLASRSTFSLFFKFSHLVATKETLQGRVSAIETFGLLPPILYRSTFSSDPRDKIYGFLAICDNRFVDTDLVADYTKTTRQVYETFFRVWLARMRSLVLLRFSGAGYPLPSGCDNTNSVDFPSWLPDWSAIRVSHLDVGGRAVYTRGFGSFLGSLGYRVSISDNVLTAAGHRVAQIRTRLRPQDDQSLLTFWSLYMSNRNNQDPSPKVPLSQALFHLILATIPHDQVKNQVSQYSNECSGEFLQAFIDALADEELICGASSQTRVTTNEDLFVSRLGLREDENFPTDFQDMILGPSYRIPQHWKGMTAHDVADYDRSVELSRSFDATSWGAINLILDETPGGVTRRPSNLHLATLGADADPTHTPDALSTKYLDSFRSCAAGVAFLKERTIFETTDGHIGFGPPLIREEDIVVILPGVGRPVVLRPAEGSYYRHMGSCLLVGVNYDEVLASLWDNMTPSEDFHLI